MMTRDKLIQDVTALLSREAHVKSVNLFGSMARGEADLYSDIDIHVKLSGVSDRAFAHHLSEAVKPLGTVLIDGWALHVLPEKYGPSISLNIRSSGTSTSPVRASCTKTKATCCNAIILNRFSKSGWEYSPICYGVRTRRPISRVSCRVGPT